ncbi:MAG: FHA domain-containing protein [Solirubrobacteraceae bacterium]
MATDARLPRPSTGSELKAVLDAERLRAPFLLLRDGEGTLRLHSLASVNTVVIGRDPAVDLAVTWDGRVSRAHTRLERIGTTWTVIDDGLSRNGTYVNGVRAIGRLRLVDGNVVNVGQTSIVFRHPISAPDAATAPDADGPGSIVLTPTQRKVLVSLCRPFGEHSPFTRPATNQEIAGELFLSVETVKTHLRSLFEKFRIGDVPQNEKRLRVVERGFEWGLVQAEDFEVEANHP